MDRFEPNTVLWHSIRYYKCSLYCTCDCVLRVCIINWFYRICVVFNTVVGDTATPCDVACTANFDSSRRLCWGPGPNLCQKSKRFLSLTQHTRLLTRGVQNVRRLTQLIARYVHHILSLFIIVSCNWTAVGPAFFQSANSVVEGCSKF